MASDTHISYLNIPPGEYIQDELDAIDMTQATLAEITGLSEKTVNQIIKGRHPINLKTAVLLANVLGGSPEYWMKIEMEYRLRLEQNTQKMDMVSLKARLNAIIPLTEVFKRGWLTRFEDPETLERYACLLLGLAGLDAFGTTDRREVAFRSTQDKGINPYYKHAWYLIARQVAGFIHTADYDPDKLKALASQIPEYTCDPTLIPEFLKRLIDEAGVRFVYLPHLPKTRIDGAAFLLPEGPAVAYSGRYDRIDHFWFTVAHELAHVLLHLRTETELFIDEFDGNNVDACEHEANTQAMEWLRTNRVADAIKLNVKYRRKEEYKDAAQNLGIHPGILVGYLHHRRYLDLKICNEFKVKILDYIPEAYRLES